MHRYKWKCLVWSNVNKESFGEVSDKTLSNFKVGCKIVFFFLNMFVTVKNKMILEGPFPQTAFGELL